MKTKIQEISKYILAKIFKLRSFLLHGRMKTIRVGNFDLIANQGHALSIYLRNRPAYASNLPRLALMVNKKYPNFTFVDIGANIGDTAAFIRSKLNCPIVCIEGEGFYFKILLKNITQFKDVYAIQSFLGESEEDILMEKQTGEGSLSLKQNGLDNSAPKLHIDTLDSISRRYQELFSGVKFIKIDTDGYDLKILRGGLACIKSVLPVVFFEYDRFFLARLSDEGLGIFQTFADLGYEDVLFFDNIGRFILALKIHDRQAIEQLYAYTYRKEGAFPFYDVCVFHRNDTDIAEIFIQEETKRNYENTV